MKIEFDKKKSADTLSGLVHSTVGLGKKAIAGAKAGVATVVKKTKAEAHTRQLKKYNPVFPEQYQGSDFHIPNIIVIVDDAVRRGIDICKGAIGWLGKDEDDEVLYLYDESVDFSGIKFNPPDWVCNKIYVVDPFDHHTFILAEQFANITLKAKMDELHHIAESIGAKRCVIEITETSQNAKTQQLSANASLEASKSISADMKHSKVSENSRRGRIETEFRGLRFPKRPTLKWFESDEKIQRLVQTCCTGRRRIKKDTLEWTISTTANISHSTACGIETIIGKALNVSGTVSAGVQSAHENYHTLLFHIEF